MDEGNEAMLHRVTTQPDPYEPFLLSQGIRFGELLFISGQAGAGDDGRIVRAASWSRAGRRLPICAARWRRAAPA
jgi:enamine deaminase RidA (YjgF/YER057c/UK114 family)